MEISSILILLLIIAAGIAALVLLLRRTPSGSSLLSSTRSRNTLLLLGLSDAGKTALFTKFKYGKVVPSCTSLAENEARIELENKKRLNLVDVPGHEKLRFRFNEFMPITKAIVFVIDSAQLNKLLRPTAEYLYQVLTNTHTLKSEIPIIMLCNKSDVLTALSKERCATVLESELDLIRMTRTKSVEEDGVTEEEYLGYENEKFRFDHLPNKIEFVEFSTLEQSPLTLLEYFE